MSALAVLFSFHQFLCSPLSVSIVAPSGIVEERKDQWVLRGKKSTMFLPKSQCAVVVSEAPPPPKAEKPKGPQA